jgi:hypothetical protein
MVPRFNCRPDDYDEFMVEEEGGEYVKAEDYEKLCNFLIDSFSKLMKLAEDVEEVGIDIEHVALNGV